MSRSELVSSTNSSAERPGQTPQSEVRLRERAAEVVRHTAKALPEELTEGVGIVVKGKTADGEQVSKKTRAAEGAKIAVAYVAPATLAALSGPLGIATGLGVLEVKNLADRQVKKDKSVNQNE